MTSSKKFIFILLLFISSDKVFSDFGDTINIVTHNKTPVVTDPSKGFNAYKNWGVFPTGEIQYRKVMLYVTYQCPDSQRCGEWDYIDNIYLRRKGSVNDTSLDIELARMISPYGSRFTPDWKFTWKADITDFSFLLHDSVEIEFNHTGYERNADRGWLITIDFELTEGPPVMEVLGFEKLWTGSFPYGDSKDDIGNYLQPVTFENKFNADIARVRILQTGHGMDDFENCAEFCSKYREVYFDNELIDKRQIWRECGDNPLYPQAGTWIFDRANWCPGAMVVPDIYDLILNDSGKHSIDIEMEKYVNPNKPSANYVFSTYLFYYRKPKALYDLSIVELVSPSKEDVYSRENPVCMNGKIIIKNNGADTTKSMTMFIYGFEGEFLDKTTFYNAPIEPGQAIIRNLPKILSLPLSPGKKKFIINVKDLSAEDEYPLDNSMTVEIEIPPVWDSSFKVLYKTNKDPSGTIISVKNSSYHEILSYKPESLKPDSLYEMNFLNLFPDCYELVIKDTANNGLDFWFNPEDGYGYVRVVDMEGRLIKEFNSDFGAEIKQQFMIITGGTTEKTDITPILNIFPIRNPGKFFCDIFLNERQNITLEITTEDKKKIVYKKKLKKFKDGMIDVDISKEPEGLYYVNVIAKNRTVSRKMKVKRD